MSENQQALQHVVSMEDLTVDQVHNDYPTCIDIRCPCLAWIC